LIAGGGAPEIHVSRLLTQHAQTLKGKEAYCFQAFAEALEIIPTTLAENAGLNPIAIVTELRNKHALGERNAGINVKKVSGERWSGLILGPGGRFQAANHPGLVGDVVFVSADTRRASSPTSSRRTSCSLCWSRRAR
jgi:T-complex protein 1 subunit delta